MKNNKFRLTEGTKVMADGSKVFRIQATKDFNDVKEGDLGGFIEKEENLSIDTGDNSWVYDDAVAYGTTRIEVNSFIDKGSEVKDSHVLNDARVGYGSTVTNSLIQSSEVQSSELADTESFSSTIGQSNIKDSEVVFSNIGDTKLVNTFIESSITTYDSTIVNSHIENKKLREVDLDGQDTRVEEVPKQESNFQLSEDDLEALNTGKSYEI